MLKKNLDYKLINLTLITIIMFLLYKMSSLWLGIISTLILIFTPFFIAFIIAYTLYPILKFLEQKQISKTFSILIIIIMLIILIAFFGLTVVPILVEQLSSLFNNIIVFIKELSLKHNLDVGPLQENLTSFFNDIILSISKYVSNGAINIINMSLSFVTKSLISLSVSIYFLIDMDKIRKNFKKYLLSKKNRHYEYFKMLDDELKKYLGGFVKIMIINTIVYTLIYLIVGHPNALLLGLLAGIANLIPFFGAITVNMLAVVTAAVNLPFPGLLIKTGIAILVVSIVDTYLTNPLVYKKSNRIHPIIVILAAFAGGYLFGIIGVVISIPVAILIITTYKFYQQDIHIRINDMKKIKRPNRVNRISKK